MWMVLIEVKSRLGELARSTPEPAARRCMVAQYSIMAASGIGDHDSSTVPQTEFLPGDWIVKVFLSLKKYHVAQGRSRPGAPPFDSVLSHSRLQSRPACSDSCQDCS